MLNQHTILGCDEKEVEKSVTSCGCFNLNVRSNEIKLLKTITETNRNTFDHESAIVCLVAAILVNTRRLSAQSIPRNP